MTLSSRRLLLYRSRCGFTLIDTLITVVILGIIAAIVIPHFGNYSSASEISSVKSTLQTVRTQLELFKFHHNDTPPSFSSFWSFLTRATDTTASTYQTKTDSMHPFGPYLQRVPINPIVSLTNCTISTKAKAGWYYSVSGGTYTFYARDTSGNTITTY